MKESIFKNAEQRAELVKELGVYYAGLGGLFGAYRDAEPAFESAKKSKIHSRIELEDSDMEAFRQGFAEMQNLRIAMQLRKSESEAIMKRIYNEVDLLGINDKVRNWSDVAEMKAEQKL